MTVNMKNFLNNRIAYLGVAALYTAGVLTMVNTLTMQIL